MPAQRVEFRLQDHRPGDAVQGQIAGDPGAGIAGFFYLRRNEMRLREFLDVEKRRIENFALPVVVAEVERGDRDDDVEFRAGPVVRIELEFAMAARKGADRAGKTGMADQERDARM